MEQSAAPDRSRLLDALTTVTESVGRSMIYLGSLSASLITLALIAQSESTADDFRLSALVILPALLFLGTVTFVRVIETGIEDAICAQAIGRIRRFYRDLAGDDARYFLLGGHDDAAGALANMGLGDSRWRPFVSVASVVALINRSGRGFARGVRADVVGGGRGAGRRGARTGGPLPPRVSSLRGRARPVQPDLPDSFPLKPLRAGPAMLGRENRRRRPGMTTGTRDGAALADDLLRRIGETVGDRATVSTVFGEPVERGGLTVIPVAKARFGFGGGGGAGARELHEGSGGGGGGGALVSPVGYIELREGSAQFKRISSSLDLVALVAAAALAVLAAKRLFAA